ncbi:hypothetical protein B0A53_00353 [Rhodotorula sp. CCFEE 5036]|nr:hypothetical protein B0A53_00353 [Rhodotorula sp. CCFEE 5036]
MGGNTVPDETNSLSLLSDPDTRIFIKVNSNGKLLPVFERSRAGDKKVMCFVPASEGVEFSVGCYFGRTKKPKSSVSVAVYFGETLASCVFHLASEINPQAPLDDESRFLMFDTSGLYDGSERSFMFGRIPTTDDPDAAANDVGYLDSVSAIRVELHHLVDARYVTTGWADASPSEKSSQKRNVKKTATAKSPTKSATKASASDSHKKEIHDTNNGAGLRPIDENFGPIVSKQPSKKDNGVAASPTATTSRATLSMPETAPSHASDSSSSEYAPEPVGRKGKKEKKTPIKEWKYKERKHASTAVFLLRSLPWISKHLEDFFFQPTPPLPSREPVVELDGAIAVDMTPEEAEEGVRAAAQIKRPAKRQKVVNLMDEHEEDAAEGGHDDYYDYSLPDPAAQGEPQGSEAVVGNDGDSSSFLADVQVGDTTASQRQAAEEHARTQALQLVTSLAQEQPDFKKIKQEVFAGGSSSGRALASGGQVYTHPPKTVFQGQNKSSSSPTPKPYPQQQQLFDTTPKIKPFQSLSSKTSHGASIATSSANGSGVGASGARIVETGTQVSMKR